MIRRLRANLLDELQKPYYVTAKAKGLPPWKALAKYPLRMSLNPFIADIGNLLPEFISGSALVAVVLSLPTTGPILVRALQTQDMYLAGSFLMLESFLVVSASWSPTCCSPGSTPHPLRRGAGPMSHAPRHRAPCRPATSTPPRSTPTTSSAHPEQERFYTASQWRLMWWKFRRHHLAVVSAAILLLFYASIVIVEFLAPYALHTRNARFIYAPPQGMHLFHEGRLIGPFVYGLKLPSTWRPSSGSTPRTRPRRRAALLLPRRQVPVLGPLGGQPPPRLPGRGRHPVPHGHRPARARRVLAHPLRCPRLAHRGPDRHHRQLRPRDRAGRASPAITAAGSTTSSSA